MEPPSRSDNEAIYEIHRAYEYELCLLRQHLIRNGRALTTPELNVDAILRIDIKKS